MPVQTELIQLCKDVSFFLNEGSKTEVWKFQAPKDTDGFCYPSQTIFNASDPDCELHLRIETYGSNKGKIEVHGNFHIARDENGTKSFEDVREHGIGGYSSLPSIAVSMSRGPEVIAKEIKRRFLPEYLPLLKKAQTKRDSREEYYRKAQSNLRTLAAIVHADMSRLKREGTEISTYSSDSAYCEVRTNDTGKTDIKITNLTFEQAKRVLAIVAERPKLSDSSV